MSRDEAQQDIGGELHRRHGDLEPLVAPLHGVDQGVTDARLPHQATHLPPVLPIHRHDAVPGAQTGLPPGKVSGREAADDPVWGVEEAGERAADLAGDGVETGAPNQGGSHNHARHHPARAQSKKRGRKLNSLHRLSSSRVAGQWQPPATEGPWPMNLHLFYNRCTGKSIGRNRGEALP